MTLIARLNEALCAVLVGVAALAAWTGGWQAEIMGATISVRALWRPLALAAVFAAFRVRTAVRDASARPIVPAGSENARTVVPADEVRTVVPEPGERTVVRNRAAVVREICDVGARVAAGAALTAGILAWFTYLSPTIGGSDSYGYASAADRIRNGRLIEVEPLAAILPFENPVSAAAPLGYVPTPRHPQASVPSYPLGFPLMMAIAATLFGDRAIFYVAPVMSGLAIAAAYWISRRWFGDSVLALTTAAALTIYPWVFAYAIQPMSDMPAAACFLVATALLLTHRTPLAALAGIAAALAFLTRPALVISAAALVLIPIVGGDKRRARAVAFAIPILMAGAAQAWLHWYLYGDVRATGYGRSDDLFSTSHLSTNARIYGSWGLLANGWLWLLGIVLAPSTAISRPAFAVLAVAAIGAVVPYAIYRPYDHWETLRFVLPALIVLTILSLAGWALRVRQVAVRVLGTARPTLAHVVTTWTVIAIATAMAAGWFSWLDEHRVFGLVRQEERYELAGQMVARVTPPNAVVLTSLHSGSIRYYAHRDTVDWAEIPPQSFDLTVATLKLKDRAVFVLLDGDEEREQFETLHGSVLTAWLPHGQRRNLRLYESPR